MVKIVGRVFEKNNAVKTFIIIEISQIKQNGTKYQNNSFSCQTKLTSEQQNNAVKDGTII